MKLLVERFKCFTSQEIEFNGLTVLAGANGSGKSSTIQALLFLRKTLEMLSPLNRLDRVVTERHFKGKRVPLNGEYCLNLGTSSIVLNNRGDNNIRLGMLEADSEVVIEFEADSHEPRLWLEVTEFSNSGGAEWPLFQKHFYYLNAERIGPRVQQDMQYSDFPHAGWMGEFTAQMLDRDKGYWKIDRHRKLKVKGSNFVKDQTNEWLDFIMPGTRVSASTNPNTLSGQILVENVFTTAQPTLATNVGFGISYVLPIVVTGLMAEKGSCFVVENPEAHLHPAAQSRIGQFIAMVANAGVNVLLETHSDHVINGIQIAAARRLIDSSLITVNYFGQSGQLDQPTVRPLHMSTKGELSEWPRGFFDQSQMDYADLISLRKV